jgi:KDO2-lipid IV(A) lauroyltransferase
MRDLFINQAFDFFLWLVRLLPYNFLKYLISILSLVATIMLKKYRMIHKRNYTLVYGEEICFYKVFATTYNIYKILGMQALDVLTFIEGKYPKYNFVSKVQGSSYLNEAINKHNGLIVVSAHIGNFTLLNLLIKELGFSNCAMVMRNVKNKHIEEKFNYIRQKANIRFFNESSIKKNILLLARLLKEKGILIMITDQRHLKGIPLKFFDGIKKTHLGPAALSILTGAPILPFFAVRAKDGGSNIVIQKPIYSEGLTLTDKNVENITLKINKALEGFIKENFNQWFCFHQLWK